jgi:hypothetical protein
VRIPDPLDRGRRNPGYLGHRAIAPVGGVIRFAVPSGIHDSFHQLGRNGRPSNADDSNLVERLRTARSKPLSPHRIIIGRQVIASSLAMRLFGTPSPVSRMIWERVATLCGVPWAQTKVSSTLRCSSESANGGAFVHMGVAYSVWVIAKLFARNYNKA